MRSLEGLREEYEGLLEELGLGDVEGLRNMEYSSVSVGRARRRRRNKVYEWLVLTGKRRVNGRAKTFLIKNFYGNVEEREGRLRRLCRLYKAIRVLSSLTSS